MKERKSLYDLNREEFEDLKEDGMLWEIYPEAPEFYWQIPILKALCNECRIKLFHGTSRNRMEALELQRMLFELQKEENTNHE